MIKHHLILISLLLALAGCRAKQPVVDQVPVRETTTVELQTIEFPGDTVVLRVPFERLSDGEQTAGVATSPNGLQLLWELKQGLLEVKAQRPTEKYQYPQVTTVREVPVEVIREVEVNRLKWWQKTLMYMGVATLLAIAGRYGYKWLKRSLVMV